MPSVSRNLVRLLVSLLCLGQRVAAESETARPNIIVILADDLGYGDLGCYGNASIRTPNIDQLAREGIRFTDFHSNGPMCSATRAALLTGRYNSRVGIEGALMFGEQGLPTNTITVAERLKELGYATALFGKWHLGDLETSFPTLHGFDEFRGYLTSEGDYKTQIDRNGEYDWYHNTEKYRHRNYRTVEITEDAVGFIEAHQNGPFFMYVAHEAIHFPWQTPMDPGFRQEGTDYNNLRKLGPRGVDEDVTNVLKDMIESLDDSVGRIMEAIKRSDLGKNTLVVFFSDNGGYVHYQGHHNQQLSSNGIYRGQKMSLYEGGHRVPAIAWWPGKISGGLESSETTMSMDFAPTFVSLAGGSLLNGNQPFDGENISNVLFAHERLAPRKLFWRMGERGAVREDSWKLIIEKSGERKLYDLAVDPGEMLNQAALNGSIVSRLDKAFARWEQEIATSAP